MLSILFSLWVRQERGEGMFLPEGLRVPYEEGWVRTEARRFRNGGLARLC